MARDMTTGREGKHILVFALPIMGGLVLQQLYNTVDSVVVGQILGPTALGAVGTCAALTMFAVSFAVGLTNGSSVIFAQLFGAKHMEDLRKNLSTAFILLTALGLFISILGFFLARPLLKALAAPDEILDMASGYFRIYCLGLVFQFVYNVSAGALRSVGDSKATLYFLCISSVVNIVLDLLFVIVFHWGVEGTAVATVIAQGLSAVVSLIYIFRKYEFYRFSKGEFRFDGACCAQILKLGVPTMVHMCIVSGGNVLIQRVVNDLGTVPLAANTAAGRIENYMFIPVQGMNNGIATFTGQNVGAGRYDRVRTGRRHARYILVPTALTISLILWVFAKPLVSIFGVEGEALTLGIQHLRFIAPFFVVFALYMSTAGILTGSGDVLAAACVTLSVLGVRVAATYIFNYVFHLGFPSLYYANPIGWAFGFIVVWLRFRTGIWETKSVVRRGKPRWKT
ncbi:MAG: MATE family efflux transporter [Oscillospiraceae bacterium]|nr:MATE family efflux transporter [Oscillospiraceae bacterium]